MQILAIAVKWKEVIREHPLKFEVYCGVDELPEAYYVRYHIWRPHLTNPPFWRYSVVLPKTLTIPDNMFHTLDTLLDNRHFDLIDLCAREIPEHVTFNSNETLVGQATIK